MPSVAELTRTIQAKQDEIAAVFVKHRTDKTDDNGNPVFSEDIPIEELKKRNDELADLGKQLDAARLIDEAYQSNVKALQGRQGMQAAADGTARGFEFPGGAGTQRNGDDGVKRFERLFTDSSSYKTWQANKQGYSIELPISMKTLFQTSAGYAPYAPRETQVIPSPQRKPVVADLIPQDDTDQPAIQYVEETTFTSAAAAVSEGATKPESTLAYTRRTVNMTKIATTIPATQEQMMFVPQIEALLRDRLGLMVLLEEDRELLNGSGTPPEMTGFLNKSGVQTQAKGADDPFTAVYKAITLVRSTVGFADPTGIVLHPNNWLTMRTTKDTTGRFILGDPSQEGPERLWGLTVVPTIAEPVGTGLVGDFRMYSHIDRRMGLTLQVGYINDDFTKNIVRILAEEYLALEIYRASAFCTVTSLT